MKGDEFFSLVENLQLRHSKDLAQLMSILKEILNSNIRVREWGRWDYLQPW
jgi:hypothetical protein